MTSLAKRLRAANLRLERLRADEPKLVALAEYRQTMLDRATPTERPEAEARHAATLALIDERGRERAAVRAEVQALALERLDRAAAAAFFAPTPAARS